MGPSPLRLNPELTAAHTCETLVLTMSIITTSLSDSLSSSVLKLDSTGLNWAIFSVCFQDAIEAKGFWGHFDSSEPRPVVSAAATTAEGDEAAQSKCSKDLAV